MDAVKRSAWPRNDMLPRELDMRLSSQKNVVGIT